MLLKERSIVPFDAFRLMAKFPSSNLPGDLLKQMEAYVHDEVTGIPFLVLESPDCEATGNTVIVVCNDFFESFLEYVSIYREVISQLSKTKIVLFNFTGQAYTLYNRSVIPNNEYISEQLDGLLNALEDQKRINFRTDEFRFVGYGYGANILLYYLCLIDGVFDVMKITSFFVINGFAYMDDMLSDTIKNAMDVFETSPKHIVELAYEFSSYLMHSKKLTREQIMEQIHLNPISIEGRISICKGCLQSVNVRKRIPKLEVSLMIMHSLDNILVHISHVDVFTTNLDEKFGVKKDAAVEIKCKKKVKFIEGGHAILRENFEKMIPILTEFCSKGRI